jgi:hypothetical protein
MMLKDKCSNLENLGKMREMGKTEADNVHAVCFVKTLIRVSRKTQKSGIRRNGPTLFFFSFFLCRSFWKSPDNICCSLGFSGPWLLFQEYGSQKFLWYTTVWKKTDNFQST